MSRLEEMDGYAEALADQHLAEQDEIREDRELRLQNIAVKLIMVKDPQVVQILREILTFLREEGN